MKKIAFILFAFIFYTPSLVAQDSYTSNIEEVHENSTNLKWISSFERASKIAKKQNKPLLIFFTGSDWCRPCQLLVEDFFGSDKFKEIADENFVLYEANFPRRTDLVSEDQKKANVVLSSKYKIKSYPTIIALDKNGNYVDKIKGYNFMSRDTDQHFNFINSVLRK